MADAAPGYDLGEILDVVDRSHAPVMVLQGSSQTIVAASPGAHELLDDIAQPLVGRRLTEFIEGLPSGAMPLLAAGRITGYETLQVLRGTEQRRRLWIRALPPAGATPVVIAVLLKEDGAGRAFVPWEDDDAPAPVIGSTDAGLIIDRVSSDVFDCLGQRPEQLIGTSFLALIVAEDIAAVLTALAATAKNREGVTLRVNVVGADRLSVTVQLVLLPLSPSPSFAFAMLTEDSAGAADARVVAELITRLGRGIRGAMTSRAVASTPVRPEVDLGRLSSRELEVVAQLMAGRRVSSIAKVLFLSEGTIRNHLSAIFGKLGVSTQPELIELLRPA